MLIMLPKIPVCSDPYLGLKEAFPQLVFDLSIKLPAANDWAETEVGLLGFLGRDRERRKRRFGHIRGIGVGPRQKDAEGKDC